MSKNGRMKGGGGFKIFRGGCYDRGWNAAVISWACRADVTGGAADERRVVEAARPGLVMSV